MRKKIEELVKTSYNKYGLKDSTRRAFEDVIEAAYTAAEATLETQEAKDAFIKSQVAAYEFAAKAAQAEVLARKTPEPTPEPTPAPTPSGGLTAEDVAKIVAEAMKNSLTPLQEQVALMQQSKTKESIFANVQAKLKAEAKSHYRSEKADRAWKYVTRGLDESNLSEDSLYSELKAEYEDLCADAGIVGFTPADSGQDPNTTVNTTALKAELEQEKKEREMFNK